MTADVSYCAGVNCSTYKNVPSNAGQNQLLVECCNVMTLPGISGRVFLLPVLLLALVLANGGRSNFYLVQGA